jgi:hypothetical protein
MTVQSHLGRRGEHTIPPGQPDQDEVSRLRQRFRRHHIFYVVSADRGVRYMAHGADLGARPHTVITDDLDELRFALEQPVSLLP